ELVEIGIRRGVDRATPAPQQHRRRRDRLLRRPTGCRGEKAERLDLNRLYPSYLAVDLHPRRQERRRGLTRFRVCRATKLERYGTRASTILALAKEIGVKQRPSELAISDRVQADILLQH